MSNEIEGINPKPSREPVHIQELLGKLYDSLSYELPENDMSRLTDIDEVPEAFPSPEPVILTRVDELRVETEGLFAEYERTGDKKLLHEMDRRREEIFWREEGNLPGLPLHQE